MDPGVASPAFFERLWAPVEFAQKCNFSSSGVRKRGWMARTEGFNLARNIPAASQELPRAPQSIPKASPERPQSVPRAPPERPRRATSGSHKKSLGTRVAGTSFFCTFCAHAKLAKSDAAKGGPGSYYSTTLANFLAAQKARPGTRAELKTKRHFGSGVFCDFCSVAFTEGAGGSQ